MAQNTVPAEKFQMLRVFNALGEIKSDSSSQDDFSFTKSTIDLKNC